MAAGVMGAEARQAHEDLVNFYAELLASGGAPRPYPGPLLSGAPENPPAILKHEAGVLAIDARFIFAREIFQRVPDLVVGHLAGEPAAAFRLGCVDRILFVHGPPSHPAPHARYTR